MERAAGDGLRDAGKAQALANLQIILDPGVLALLLDLDFDCEFRGVNRQADGKIALLFHDSKAPERSYIEPIATIRR